MNYRLLHLSVAVLALSGCSTASFLTSTAPVQTIYALRPAQTTADAPATASTTRIIEIAKPVVPPGFDRDRIALYVAGGQKLDYFASALWPTTFDEVIQTFTRRTAGIVLPYVVAVTPEQSFDADYRLQVKINEFQPVYATDIKAAPNLVAEIEFTLLALPDEKMITSFVIKRQAPASANGLDAITADMEKMLQEIERDAFMRLEPRLKNRSR